MCLCVVADGDVLGDGGDSSAHDRHAARCLVPHVRHHDGLRCESVRLILFDYLKVSNDESNFAQNDDCFFFLIC